MSLAVCLMQGCGTCGSLQGGVRLVLPLGNQGGVEAELVKVDVAGSVMAPALASPAL